MKKSVENKKRKKKKVSKRINIIIITIFIVLTIIILFSIFSLNQLKKSELISPPEEPSEKGALNTLNSWINSIISLFITKVTTVYGRGATLGYGEQCGYGIDKQCGECLVCKRAKLRMIKFYADWCGPCKTLSGKEEFKAFVKKFNNYYGTFEEIDIDKNPSLYQGLIPALIIVDDNVKINGASKKICGPYLGIDLPYTTIETCIKNYIKDKKGICVNGPDKVACSIGNIKGTCQSGKCLIKCSKREDCPNDYEEKPYYCKEGKYCTKKHKFSCSTNGLCEENAYEICGDCPAGMVCVKADTKLGVSCKVVVSYCDRVKFIDWGRKGPYSSTLRDIIDHQGQILYSSDDDLGHETVHGINAAIRNKYDGTGYGGTGNVNGFYLLNGRAVVLKEPGIKISNVVTYIPLDLKRKSSYSLYIIGQQSSWNNEPLYILDELTAYTNGALVSIETGQRESMNIPDFMVYSLALGLAIKNLDKTYWNSRYGKDFRNFLGCALERAMDAHVKQTIKNSKTKETALQTFKTMTNSQIQQFAKETFGSDWTQRILGF